MAGMKSWLEKIKNRILKKDLDDDLLKSKIQSDEKIKENELPDLITPTNEEINKTSRVEQKETENQKTRGKEAMKVSDKMKDFVKRNIEIAKESEFEVNIKNQHFKYVPKCRNGLSVGMMCRSRSRW